SQEREAVDRMSERIRLLPTWAAVILPADGESNVDHQALRRIVLEGAVLSGRADVRLYEAAEYNHFLSLTRCPAKAFWAIARSLPLMSRLLPVPKRRPPSRFVNGSKGMCLPPDPNRVAEKEELIRGFTSEGGESLVRSFGRPDRYRLIADPRQ